MLAPEFPLIAFVPLEGYNIRYGKTRAQTLLKIFLQIPKILIRVKREYRWTRKFLLKNHLHAIISDNRYGIYSAGIPSVFITHQLGIISGLGKIPDRIVQRILYSYIRKFSVCWVPDWMNADLNLAGNLSHPQKNPELPVRYIGCLSRLEPCTVPANTKRLLIILSGPEPQRTIAEKIILDQLQTYTGTAVVVRGVFDNSSIKPFGKISIVNNATSVELNRLFCEAEIVISRAGYTSVMDILKLKKRSILIPTPGQAEQEYLALYLRNKKIAYSISQKNFCLNKALEDSAGFNLVRIEEPMELFKNVVDELVRSLEEQMINHRA
jgi:UDP-N-acetylglucosamine transferase subunit ALG13